MSVDGTTLSPTSLSSALTIGRPERMYPSPFFDLSRTYLPRTIKETFDWCAYYYLTNPVINGVCSKLAAYAITDMVFAETPEGAVYKRIFDRLNMRTVLVEHNLDRSCFGNALITVFFPFIKMLTCPSCEHVEAAETAKWKWKGGKFLITCNKCRESGYARARDVTTKAESKVRIIKWNPRLITIRRNDSTGRCRYFYEMPKYLRNEIMQGVRSTIIDTPQAYLDALLDNKAIEIDSGKIFHSRRPSISRDPEDDAWGIPLILPVLKDIFLVQILKKSQEAVAMEYVLPLRSLYPDVRADGNNVYSNINLKDWQESVVKQVKQWKKDPSHIAVMPVPVGQQTMGGTGRQMLLHQEVRFYNDTIVSGMGVPTGFYYGEAMYSGASVNMRALENEFIANRQDMEHLVEFIVDKLAEWLSIAPSPVKFLPFKMADDMPRKQFLFNLAAQGFISREAFLSELDFSFKKENEAIIKEMEALTGRATAQAKSQAAAQAVMAANQPQQPAPPPQMGAPAQAGPPMPAPAAQQGLPIAQGQVTRDTMFNPQMDIGQAAEGIANQLRSLPEVNKYQALASLRRSNPDLYSLVNQSLNREVSGPERQLPEQLPPRAGPANAML